VQICIVLQWTPFIREQTLLIEAFTDRERRDKPAHCRGCESATEKEKRLHSGMSRNAYCLMGGYDGLKFLFIVNKKLTGTKMPLFCRVNAKACSTS
jgi:hypothetical protein